MPELIQMKLSDIKPYERNPRRNDDSVQAVANSINAFGFRSPIIVDADNVIIADRTRTTVAESTLDIEGMSERQAKDTLKKMLAEYPSDVIHEDKPARSADHPTMKPVALMARQIFNSTHAGDVVLDPFGGSGSTLAACEQIGRRCAIMELDPVYCDVIIKRWENLTGRTAERVAP